MVTAPKVTTSINHLILLTALEWLLSFLAILNPLVRPIFSSSTSVPQFGLHLIGALCACVTLLRCSLRLVSMESNRLIFAFVLPYWKRCGVSIVPTPCI